MKAIVFFLATLMAHSVAFAASFSGRVIGVADGDTITILQAIGELTFGKQADAHCPTVDRYGRDVCKVTVDGLDVGLALIRQGYAWHFKKYQRTQAKADRAIYSDAEDRARAELIGLWRDPKPIAPWDWRKAKREDAAN
jgi:endonuclease YncB( thermonuclease family)